MTTEFQKHFLTEKAIRDFEEKEHARKLLLFIIEKELKRLLPSHNIQYFC